MYVLLSYCSSATWYDRRTLGLFFLSRVKKRFYFLLDISWIIGSNEINNTLHESLNTQLLWARRTRAWHLQGGTTPTSWKKWLFSKMPFSWKVIKRFHFFLSQHPGSILIRKIYIRSHGDFFDLFCYFSGTVDGFFRILEKTSSKLICTQLHFFSWGYVYFQL